MKHLILRDAMTIVLALTERTLVVSGAMSALSPMVRFVIGNRYDGLPAVVAF